MTETSDAVPNEGERFFRELADNAPVMIWRSGADGLCDWFNKPWLDFVGRSMGQEVGSGWTEGVHPEDLARCLNIYLSAVEARRDFTMSYRLRRADGVYREILDNGAPFQRDGHFAGYFGSCIDITDQRTSEEQLRQSHKMEAIGQLTGGVAHDFNNLLQVISASLQLLSRDLPDDDRVRRRLHGATEAVARGARLASHLLTFARRQSLRPRVVDLGRLLTEIDDMLRRTLGEAVEVETQIAQGLWTTRIDTMQLETALLNLAVNARDAMEGRGNLRIEVANATLDGARLGAGRADIGAGEYVVLTVTDTGCGMSKETIERAFDPFFTTKAEGSGTGLGLSMVHGFVTQSEGHVTISSEIGRGTSVRLYLPRSHGIEEPSSEPDLSRARGGAETVLLIEDDDDVRGTTSDMLVELGYKVLEARDADGAMAIIDAGATPDLLFADVVTPGSLRSTELARIAQERLPQIAVLFTSGYTDKSIRKGRALDEGAELLSKPYTREELDRRLRRVLATRRASLAPESPRLVIAQS
jgi:PAS domain S-box-containing protein